MRIRRSALLAALATALLTQGLAGRQSPSPTAPPPSPIFAVLFKTGPNWDSAKAPNEQAFFREHSENLQALRAEGRVPIGGRFSDLGLLLVTAASEDEARAMFDRDPAVKNGTFVFEVHPFRPFFTGCVGKTQ